MIVDPRPYIVVKKLRAQDVREGDVVALNNNRWVRAIQVSVAPGGVNVGFVSPDAPSAPHPFMWFPALALIDVQVRENPRAVPDPPPVPVELDTRYRDAMRGTP